MKTGGGASSFAATRRGTRRRDLLVGAAATVLSRRAAAQEAPKSAHIGFIVTGEAFPRHWFDEAMVKLGWVEGRNLLVARRVTGEDAAERNTAAAELVAANPDAIVAAGTVDALPVHALTRTIPIVVISGFDLVEARLADSLAHPGGNLIGMTVLGGELDGKRLELLRELVPWATRISVLGSALMPRSIPRITAIEALARPLGIRVAARLVSKAGEFDGAFAASAADHDQAMLVQTAPCQTSISLLSPASQRNTACRRSTTIAGSSKSAVWHFMANCGRKISNAPPPSSTRS
jgi:putative ABC transport system substrate-binding protein